MPTTQPNGRKNPNRTPITINAIAIPIIETTFPGVAARKRRRLSAG
jgi:hypothetical protein